MRRREFITLLGGAAVAWPQATRAQHAGTGRTIGVLGTATPSAWSLWIAAFVQRLRELGWIEGSNVAIEYPLLGSAAATWSLTTRAQQPAIPRQPRALTFSPTVRAGRN